jgi:hypothetical protein
VRFAELAEKNRSMTILPRWKKNYALAKRGNAQLVVGPFQMNLLGFLTQKPEAISQTQKGQKTCS